jgi:hypothetical protein
MEISGNRNAFIGVPSNATIEITRISPTAVYPGSTVGTRGLIEWRATYPSGWTNGATPILQSDGRPSMILPGYIEPFAPGTSVTKNEASDRSWYENPAVWLGAVAATGIVYFMVRGGKGGILGASEEDKARGQKMLTERYGSRIADDILFITESINDAKRAHASSDLNEVCGWASNSFVNTVLNMDTGDLSKKQRKDLYGLLSGINRRLVKVCG